MPLRCPRPIAIGLLCVLSASAAAAEIVVTATRVAQTVDESLAPVTVITRDDIDRRQPADMAQLFQLVPSLDVTRTGGPGAAINVFLRGSNSNHVLVLVDGVRAGSATTGAFAWESLSPSQIERVEVVRGPRAAYYGSDAIGGVIQVFTRRPTAPSARVELGSFATRRLQVGFGGGEAARFAVHYEHAASDGFSATNPAIDNPAFCPPFCSFDPDDDGFKSDSLTASLEADVAPGTRAGLRLWLAEGENDFDDGVGNTAFTESRNQTTSGWLKQELSERWSHMLAVNFTADELDSQTSNPSSFSSRIQTTRWAVDWQHDLVIGEAGLAVFGLNYYEDRGKTINTTASTTTFDAEIDNVAAFFSYERQLGAHDVQLAARRDRHSTFGTETTGQVAWGVRIEPDMRLLASYGTAYRAPSLNELFHPGFSGFFAGNPALRPETSKNYELGLRIEPGAGQRWTASLFRTEVDDLIANEGPSFQAVNIDEASVRGVEIEYGYVSKGWLLDSGITLQRATNERTGEPLLRRPERKASLGLSRRLGDALRVGGEVILRSERRDVGGVTLPGYGLVNLVAAWRLHREWTLEGRVDNALDKRYELVSGFNTPERSLFVSVRYMPGGRGGEN